MKNRYQNGRSHRHRGSGNIGPHLLLGAFILCLALFAAARLLIWNRGTQSGYDASAVDTSSVAVEVQDFIVPLSEEQMAGHTYDSVTRILCLGGNPWLNDTSDTGIASVIAQTHEHTETVVAAFPDSRVTSLSPTYDPSTQEGMDDIFNLFYVAYAIYTDDYAGLTNVSAVKEDPRYAQAVQTLKETDFDIIDVIAIAYDGIDYRTKAPVMNSDPDDISSYAGALKRAAELLTKRYPFIRVVFLSPTYERYVDEAGRELDPVETDLGNGEMPGYISSAFLSSSAAGISFVDNYSGSVNALNYRRFLDGPYRLNADGNREVARHFVKKILENDPAEYQPPAAQ